MNSCRKLPKYVLYNQTLFCTFCQEMTRLSVTHHSQFVQPIRASAFTPFAFLRNVLYQLQIGFPHDSQPHPAHLTVQELPTPNPKVPVPNPESALSSPIPTFLKSRFHSISQRDMASPPSTPPSHRATHHSAPSINIPPLPTSSYPDTPEP